MYFWLNQSMKTWGRGGWEAPEGRVNPQPPTNRTLRKTTEIGISSKEFWLNAIALSNSRFHIPVSSGHNKLYTYTLFTGWRVQGVSSGCIIRDSGCIIQGVSSGHTGYTGWRRHQLSLSWQPLNLFTLEVGQYLQHSDIEVVFQSRYKNPVKKEGVIVNKLQENGFQYILTSGSFWSGVFWRLWGVQDRSVVMSDSDAGWIGN